MGRSGFRGLEVWKRSRDLAVLIHTKTADRSYMRDPYLRDQMRRAAVSISSNIAEGDERGTNKESVRFLYIAKGSLAELITQVEISNAANLLNIEDFHQIINECEMIGKMLGRLIKVRSSHYP